MNSALETQSTRYTNNVDCDYGIFYLSFGTVLETLTAVRWGEVSHMTFHCGKKVVEYLRRNSVKGKIIYLPYLPYVGLPS